MYHEIIRTLKGLKMFFTPKNTATKIYSQIRSKEDVQRMYELCYQSFRQEISQRDWKFSGRPLVTSTATCQDIMNEATVKKMCFIFADDSQIAFIADKNGVMVGASKVDASRYFYEHEAAPSF